MTCKNCSSCRYLPTINKHMCYGVKEPFYIKDIDAKCSEYSDEYWRKQERIKTTNCIERLQAELEASQRQLRAAMERLTEYRHCQDCKFGEIQKQRCYKLDCKNQNMWQWRGPEQEGV